MSKHYLSLLFTLAYLVLQGQNKASLSGYVRDATNGEYLIGASIFVKSLGTGAQTNTYGYFSIAIPEGKYEITVSIIGFETQTVALDIKGNFRQNFSLKPKVYESKVVEIVANKAEDNVRSTDMGRVEINVESMKKLPALMGEVDVIRVIQLIPGVKTSGEGNTGFYVRGGGPDQNLVLLDEAVVYNAGHLFGFFSVFNADAIKSVDLQKGGMPAQYGGRISSVLDIQMKEGNNQKLQVDGGIGLIASRLTVQGPIKKDTASFIVSARRTYLDVLIQPFIKPSSPFKGSGYYFYDLNTKFNYRLSDKDRIFVSGYFGRDVFNFQNTNSGFDINIPWGNATASVRWNHLFSNKLFCNTSLIFSDYDFRSSIQQTNFRLGVFSGIRDYNAKSDFTYYANEMHTIKFGLNYIFHRFTPNNASASFGDTEFDLGPVERMFGHESAIYLSDDMSLTDRLNMHIGLRYSMFNHVGPFRRYVRNEQDITVGIKDYNRGDLIKTYQGFEPRFLLRYGLPNSAAIKAGITRNYQYLHLTSFANVSLPTDIWIPSTDLVNPINGMHYSLGYYKNFKENTYETSAEIYYKTMNNLVEFKDGTLQSSGVNNNIDNTLTFGSGQAYGIELFAKKSYGELSGWLGYTLSYTTRLFAELNNGERFFARYDRRHDISAVVNYDINKKWSLGAVFVYGTGNLLWLPNSIYFFEGEPVLNYGERNNFRMPAYHRLDFSITRKNKETRKFSSNWNFSIYNVYSRLNPYFIYIDPTGSPVNGTFQAKAKMVSLFPIIPALTYNFKF